MYRTVLCICMRSYLMIALPVHQVLQAGPTHAQCRPSVRREPHDTRTWDVSKRPLSGRDSEDPFESGKQSRAISRTASAASRCVPNCDKALAEHGSAALQT